MSALQTIVIVSGKHQLQVTYIYLFRKYWLLSQYLTNLMHTASGIITPIGVMIPEAV